MSAPTRVSESWPYVREMADRMSASKRLSDAELAAEFWRISWAAEMDPFGKFEDEMEVMFRFARLPHYDQEQP